MDPVTLRTSRLILRPWRDEDLEPFARINRDPEVNRFAFRPLDRDMSDAMADRIRDHFRENGWGFWAVERPPDPFLGFIGLDHATFAAPFTPCVEMGWRLDPAVWGKGLATEGAQAVLDFAGSTLALDEVVAFTSRLNTPSMRVMEKLGMVRDPRGDFLHPAIPREHPLAPHVLYRIRPPRQHS